MNSSKYPKATWCHILEGHHLKYSVSSVYPMNCQTHTEHIDSPLEDLF
jgi:hypothetical protein